jgi:hypothetical protein
MNMMIDLRKIGYLINVLGRTLQESLNIDVRLASRYGLMPQLSAVRPARPNGTPIELARRSVERGVS